MGRIITITSGKGGVGKTTTSANLSASLALAGKRTIAVDTDIGLRNLDVVMGLENRVVYDIVNVAEGAVSLEQAWIKHKRVQGLYMLPASQSRNKNAVSVNDMKRIGQELKQKFDYVIIDCPAGIEQGFQNAIAAADEIIVVTTPEVSAVRDADRVIGLLENASKEKLQLIINRLKPAMVKRGEMMSTGDVTEILAISLLGVVPDDEKIIVSTNCGELAIFNPASVAGKAFKTIARRLLGEEVVAPRPVEASVNGAGVMNKLKHFFFGANDTHPA
ncbi:MAG: septum site-determining protein MinD [Acidobacteria bacterium]|nr:septum site-determining protein MinD [Acidobacteriota bacterium]